MFLSRIADFIEPCADSRHSVPDAAWQPYKITKPPRCLTVGMLFFSLKPLFFSSVDIELMELSNKVLFCLIYPKKNLTEALWFVKIQLQSVGSSFSMRPTFIQSVTYSATGHCWILILEVNLYLFSKTWNTVSFCSIWDHFSSCSHAFIDLKPFNNISNCGTGTSSCLEMVL